MSTIFISHSSKENSFAVKVTKFLNQIGHRSVFLDFDPEYGIPAGRSWEKELYTHLRSCQALIVLYSKDFISSPWCFAEITHAKALGKYIIPLKIDDCTINSIFLDVQVIDATTNIEEAFKRLEKGLYAAGINKESWDNTRPPYPGLLAFQEEDAPIFFGRDQETENLLKSLRQFRSFGGPKVLLILGASGSGKSSLIRAGVIPQLHKDKKSWIVVGPFRPLKTPFEELSKSIANAFHSFQDDRNWMDIYNSLIDNLKNTDVAENTLSNLLTQLIELSKQADATVLLFIDQFEELFSYFDKGNATGESAEQLFLFYLRSFLDVADNKFLIISTLRSDFLGNFQQAKSLEGLSFDDYIVKPVSPEGLKASIVEPAKVAGIELEAGLAEVMLEDTGASDALPLVAFTLRELWEQYGRDGLLSIDEYKNKLGGLEGSVARVAEAVLMAHIAETGRGELIKTEKNENKAKLNTEDEQQLKIAFMAMVRIDEEGRFTRRITNWDELPHQINKLLQRFVTARLLTSSGDGKNIKIEVAHEAIFRTWTRLVKWLQDDNNFLIWRKRLNTAQDEWERNKKNESELLRGPALGEAIEWLHQHKLKNHNLTSKEIEFIDASHKESEKQRLKKLKNLRLLSGAALVVLIIIGVLYYKNYQTNINTQNQLARNYWNTSQRARSDNNLLGALHFTAEAINSSKNEDMTENLFIDIKDILSEIWIKHTNLVHKGIYNATLHPGGKWILTCSKDSTARLWEVESGIQIGPSMKHNAEVWEAIFSPDGKRILTLGGDSTARLWEMETGKQIGPPMKHNDEVEYGEFSADGKRILTLGRDSTVQLWEAGTGKQIGPSMKHSAEVEGALFSGREKRILTWSRDDTVRVWEVGIDIQLVASIKHDNIDEATFSVDQKQILTWGGDSTARVWNAETGEQVGPSMKHTQYVSGASFSADGKWIVTCSSDSTARLWKAETVEQVGYAMNHKEGVRGASFSADGKWILTWSGDSTARLWETGTGWRKEVIMKHDAAVKGAAFSVDQKRILTWADDNAARIWDARTGKQVGFPLMHDGNVEAGFSVDGKQILTWSEDGTVYLWRTRTREENEFIVPIKHDNVKGVTFSLDRKQILCWSDDSTVCLWEAGSGNQIGPSMNHNNRVEQAMFSADQKRILTRCVDSTVWLWETGTGKQVIPPMKSKCSVRVAAVSADRKQVLTWCNGGTVNVWNAESPTQVSPSINFSGYHGDRAIFSADGKRVLIPGAAGIFSLWELRTGKQVGDSMKYERATSYLSNTNAVFSADEKQILTWGYDNTARLWESATGKQIGPSMVHDNFLEGAAFSRDNKRILTWSQDGTARLWKGGTGEQIGPSIMHYNKDHAVFDSDISGDGKRILTMDYRIARLWEAETGKPIGVPIYEVSDAIFSSDKNRILVRDDSKIYILENEIDLDIPPELFKLQISVITGVTLNVESNIIKCIPPEQWYKLKKEYIKKAQQHYKICKYPKQNLWRRFFPK